MKIKILSAFLFAVFFSAGNINAQTPPVNPSPNVPSAQPKTVTVATVDIYDSKIISQDGSTLKISFDLSNRVGVQPDVRYSLALIEETEKGQNLIDEKIYDEKISLNENETLKKEIIYQAPSYLKGNYTPILFAKNSAGMDFAISPLAPVTFSGTGEYVQIKNETCYLKIKGDESGVKYSLMQGVDIAKDENLILSCVVKNNYTESIIISPEFITHQGSVLGEIVEAEKGFYEPIAIASMEEKEISYETPKAKESRAYNISMKLVGKNGEISNEIISHYIVRGQIGIIKNIRPDKDYYQKGDIAKILLDWLPLINSFQNSRKITDYASQALEVEIGIKNKESKDCIQLKKIDLKNQIQVNLDFQVIEDCQNPVIIASLKDMQGNVVDLKELRVESRNIPSKKIGSSSILFVIIVLAVLLVVLVVILLALKRKSNSRVVMLLVGILFSSVLFFSMGNRAMASTFSIFNDYGPLVCTYWSDSCEGACPTCSEWWGGVVEVGQVTVNLNKSTYSPGESIVTSGSFKNLVADFGETVLDLTSTINGVTSSMLHYTSANRNNVYIASATTTPAQTLGGTFNATFVGSQYTPDFRTNFTWYFSGASASVSIPYTIPAVPCNLPWGGTIASGSGVTAYASSSVSCGSTCLSQTRTCTNGTLSGSYTNLSCAPAACASCTVSTWTPSTSTVCTGIPFTQTESGCGGTRGAIGSNASLCTPPPVASCPASYSDVVVTGATTGATTWGSGPYTDDSNIATAAVHAGLIAVGETATIKRASAGSLSNYTGTTANGVTTSSWTSEWCGVNLSKATTRKLTVSAGLNTTVSSGADGKIACSGATCIANYNDGTTVTLTGSATSPYVFNNPTSWTSGCSSITPLGVCRVIMGADKTINASATCNPGTSCDSSALSLLCPSEKCTDLCGQKHDGTRSCPAATTGITSNNWREVTP
ncbi:MAG: hypothetical protein ACD_8C00151G0002 [uncultured bacterium]|nr:MAG: hypothetical protein ACD_8C00151G0002 [uncultured bacterium]